MGFCPFPTVPKQKTHGHPEALRAAGHGEKGPGLRLLAGWGPSTEDRGASGSSAGPGEGQGGKLRRQARPERRRVPDGAGAGPPRDHTEQIHSTKIRHLNWLGWAAHELLEVGCAFPNVSQMVVLFLCLRAIVFGRCTWLVEY